MKLKRWRTTEEAMLRDHYRTIGPEACADMLGRTVQAIHTRAYKLGLTDKDKSRAQRFHAQSLRGIRGEGLVRYYARQA